MNNQRPMRVVAALWGVAGYSTLLLSAMLRLGAQALAAFAEPLGGIEWAVLVVFAAFMLYSEGYRGFHQRYAPRFARRIVAIRNGDSLLEAVLAPLYAMGFFRATRREMITTYLLVLLILALIFLFHVIPQPWRGVLDFGVVLGLGAGLVSSWYHVVVAWRSPDRPADSSPRAT